MSKGTRERERRKAEAHLAEAEPKLRLFHGTAGVTGPNVKARGMSAAEHGLLLCESPELARPPAVAATARLMEDGVDDCRGLIVEVALAPDRAHPVDGLPGHWLVKHGVRPGEIVDLNYFDASGDLEDPDVRQEMADAFDTDSQDWRRAATGEMEP